MTMTWHVEQANEPSQAPVELKRQKTRAQTLHGNLRHKLGGSSQL